MMTAFLLGFVGLQVYKMLHLNALCTHRYTLLHSNERSDGREWETKITATNRV